MKPSDLGALAAAGSPRLSPDGSLVAFVVSRIDLEGNSYRSQIWLTPTDGSRPPEPFTSGEHRDGSPVWSPDGRRLAFTSSRGDDGASTVHVAPVVAGGEVVTLASLPDGARELAWSPDGRHLACTARTRDERYNDDPKRQAPRRITRLRSRLDDVGWISDRPSHVYVIPVDGSGPPRNLTPGEFHHSSPSWSPDSQDIVCGAARHDAWDVDLCEDLYRLSLDGEAVALTKQTGAYGSPAWAPHGHSIAFLGVDDARVAPQNGHVGILELNTGARSWVSNALDRTFESYPSLGAPVWHSDSLLCVTEDRGNAHIYRVRADGSDAPELVVGGDRCITGFDASDGVIAFTATTADRPAELFVRRDGEERRLTSAADAFVAASAPLIPEHFTVATDEGVDVDTWVFLPPSYEPGGQYPALLNIHGGPFTQYGNRFFDEAQVQASAGYVVVLSNPRGSSGRSERWGRAIAGTKSVRDPGSGWGSVDYDDLMAVMDAVLARYPAVDRSRLGVIGGSYGGYMTSWIVGHTDRFAAACSERAVNDLISEDWGSDIAATFAAHFGPSSLDDPEEYRRMSPVSYVRSITTPLLILHSEDDLRCPVGQAEQLFMALRLLGKEVEFYRFPAEGHELSRSGAPVHRVQRFELILDFFARHLHP
jgi:dipeptidyl aminopeptidase/acylaminoacyl peptidase